MADLVDSLPVDRTPLRGDEVQVVNMLFNKNKKETGKIVGEMKEALFGGVLFAILSLPQIDSLIKSLVTVANTSPIFLLGIKALLFAAVFYFVKNLYLVKK